MKTKTRQWLPGISRAYKIERSARAMLFYAILKGLRHCKLSLSDKMKNVYATFLRGFENEDSQSRRNP